MKLFKNLIFIVLIGIGLLFLGLLVQRFIFCIDMRHSCLSTWGDFAGGVGTLLGVGVAIWAGTQWREQRRTEFEEKWAFDLNNNLTRLERAFDWRRATVFFEGETEEMKEKEINEATREFMLAAQALEYIWGDEFNKKIQEIFQKIRNLELHVFYLKREQKLLGQHNNQFSIDRLNEYADIANQQVDPTKSDSTRDDFKKITGELRRFLLTKLSHLGRIKLKIPA